MCCVIVLGTWCGVSAAGVCGLPARLMWADARVHRETLQHQMIITRLHLHSSSGPGARVDISQTSLWKPVVCSSRSLIADKCALSQYGTKTLKRRGITFGPALFYSQFSAATLKWRLWFWCLFSRISQSDMFRLHWPRNSFPFLRDALLTHLRSLLCWEENWNWPELCCVEREEK